MDYSVLGSNLWITAVNNCYGLSFTIKGLQEGAEYIFRVRAVNIHGSSLPGITSESVRIGIYNNTKSSYIKRLMNTNYL